ncbi:MAG: flagellar biosynthetic protein FliR [Phycisphaerales bacterium]
MLDPRLKEIVELLEGLPKIPVVQAGALLVARITPIASLTPVFGGNVAPKRYRFAIAIMLAACFAPAVTPATLDNIPAFHWLLLKEALIGLVLSLLISVMFETYVAAGKLIDDSRGAGNAELFDPFNNRQQSTLGQWLYSGAIAAFLGLGGHKLVLEALVTGIESYPIFSLPSAAQMQAASPVALIAPVGELVVAALRLAAPVMIMALAVDLGLGVINRFSPTIPATVLGFGVKGLLAPLLAAAALTLAMTSPMERFMELLNRAVAGGP